MTESEILSQPNHLAVKMFQKFARFEYALKASGFYEGDKPPTGEKPAKPGWVKFSRVVADRLENPRTEQLKAAVNYICQTPPMQHVIKADGSLGWGIAKKNDSKAAVILLYVCQVRNNLFHGGKLETDGQWVISRVERSKLLIEHSLTILDECLEACPKVKDAYNYTSQDFLG